MRSIELASDTPLDFSLGVELQEQIVVTALRRAERLQDVPATVDAFDAGMIEQAGITSMRDYVAMAPQISLVETQNIGFTFVNVRGLSQVRNSEPTVAVVVDGVLQTTGLGFSEELFDIEQVEVLKGPQGALYGRNASGGAINITTRQPTNALEAFARGGFGNGENKSFVGSLSGALVPDVLFGRAALSLKDAEGWRENITLRRKADSYTDRSFRGRLMWRPAPAVVADFRLAYSNTEAFQSQFVSNAPNFVEPPPVGGLPGLAANVDGRTTVPRPSSRVCRRRSPRSSAIRTTPPSRSRATSPASTIARSRRYPGRSIGGPDDRQAHFGHLVRQARSGRHSRNVPVLPVPAVLGGPDRRHP